MEKKQPEILLTGATGYIGRKLLKQIGKMGLSTRCLVRHPKSLTSPIGPDTEVAQGDVLKLESLKPAFRRIKKVFYLIHALGSKRSFEQEESIGAQNFSLAAKEAGVEKIIYLGGLASPEVSLSEHMKSRQQVGSLLRSSGIPVLEFRASVILGSGSLSFEMVRSLVEKLPVMILPQWVQVLAQPIAIKDVLNYLMAALDFPSQESGIYEIGGKDQVSYGDLMKEYAKQRGLKRIMIPVPVLTPHLSSLWLHLFTPIYARIGKRLIESIRYPSIVTDPKALRDFPIKPMGFREAMAEALKSKE